MRIGFLLVPLFATACATTATAPRERDRVALDRELAGRVAGKPVDCLSAIDTRDAQTFNGVMLYRTNSRVVYRQDFNGCAALDWNTIPVFEIHGSQLCRGDIVRIVDRGIGGQRGACSLGPFVPYTRVN